MKASDFYTVPRSEEGVEVPLLGPNNEPTEGRIRIVGQDSKAYRAASAELVRRNAEIGAMEDRDAADILAAGYLLDFQAALITGWNFDEEFTPANLREFLTNAPRIGAQIQGLCEQVHRFFGPASTNSTPGQPSSDAPGQETLNLQRSA
jgi:hypothetical protein